jgi:hypothetical protein
MTNLRLPKFKLVYSQLATPGKKLRKGVEVDNYVIEMMFDVAAQETSQFKELVSALQQTALENFGSNAKNTQLPIKRKRDNGSTPAWLPEGGVFMRADTQFKPIMVGKLSNGLWGEINPDRFYSGCFCTAQVKIYTTGGGKTGFPQRVQLSLDDVVFLSDGEKLRADTDYNTELKSFEGVATVATSGVTNVVEAGDATLPSY